MEAGRICSIEGADFRYIKNQLKVNFFHFIIYIQESRNERLFAIKIIVKFRCVKSQQRLNKSKIYLRTYTIVDRTLKENARTTNIFDNILPRCLFITYPSKYIKETHITTMNVPTWERSQVSSITRVYHLHGPFTFLKQQRRNNVAKKRPRRARRKKHPLSFGSHGTTGMPNSNVYMDDDPYKRAVYSHANMCIARASKDPRGS